MAMNYDVIIIGGGPAGLSFAKALADTTLKIALIEKSSLETLENPPYDGREIALTHLSKKIMSELDVWQQIPEEKISIIRHAKVFNGNSDYSLHFDYQETDQEYLGFMVANNDIRKATYDAVKNAENITFLTETEVSRVSTDDDGGYVTLSDDKELSAKLVVSADSRFSNTRRMMGISTSMLDFGRTCIVSKMKITGDHEKTAMECFYFDQTLAVLPLNNGEVSVVITIDSDKAESILSMSGDEFNADIERRTNGQFGTMALSAKLYPYPLVATFAKTFVGQRFAVIGDAAVGMHPVTAHGFNLGVRSAHRLAQGIKTAIAAQEDFFAESVLSAYSRDHRRHAAPLYHGTNALVKLYTKTGPAAKLARRVLLRLGNYIKPAKQMITKQLTDVG